MTVEHKIVVGLDDIKAVTLECAKCKTRLTVPPDRITIPNRCPSPRCDQQWLSDIREHVSAPNSSYLQFCVALSELRSVTNHMPFTIRLEFEEQS
jgi:hypothetical protein